MNWIQTKNALPIIAPVEKGYKAVKYHSRPVLICTKSGNMEVAKLLLWHNIKTNTFDNPQFIDRRGFVPTAFSNIVAWADINPYTDFWGVKKWD